MEKMLTTTFFRKLVFLFLLLCFGLSACQIQGINEQAGVNRTKPCSGPGSDTNLLQPWQSLSGFIRVMSSPFAPTQPSTLPPRINLRVPVAVAASPGTIYIADAGHKAVFRYERASNSISLFTTLPGADFSTRLFLDEDLSLYVLDQFNAEILQFDPSGRLVQRFANSAELPQPVAVTVSRGRREILVADGLRGHVLAFDQLGGIASVFGSRADDALRFDQIIAMARGGEGIYIVDKLQHRVHHLRAGRQQSFGGDELISPGQIAVDDYNRVFVADKAGTTIKVFQAGKRINAPAGPGFQQITGLWADSGFLYVADVQRASIDIFQIVPPCV